MWTLGLPLRPALAEKQLRTLPMTPEGGDGNRGARGPPSWEEATKHGATSSGKGCMRGRLARGSGKQRGMAGALHAHE